MHSLSQGPLLPSYRVPYINHLKEWRAILVVHTQYLAGTKSRTQRQEGWRWGGIPRPSSSTCPGWGRGAALAPGSGSPPPPETWGTFQSGGLWTDIEKQSTYLVLPAMVSDWYISRLQCHKEAEIRAKKNSGHVFFFRVMCSLIFHDIYNTENVIWEMHGLCENITFLLPPFCEWQINSSWLCWGSCESVFRNQTSKLNSSMQPAIHHLVYCYRL